MKNISGYLAKYPRSQGAKIDIFTPKERGERLIFSFGFFIRYLLVIHFIASVFN
jgi:hypothetical protein